MTHRWRLIPLLFVILLALTLAACGGDEDDNPSGGDASGGDTVASDDTASGDAATPSTRPPTHTPYPPPPRERLEPEVDPYDFEPPFSVGNFVRESLRGNVTAVSAGGLQAIYRRDAETIVLKVYHFDQASNASTTVQDALQNANIVAEIEPIYESPSVNYGLVQDKHGAYIAAWNNYRWAFIVTTPAPVDALNEFMKLFQF